jgi:hypothetical protein
VFLIVFPCHLNKVNFIVIGCLHSCVTQVGFPTRELWLVLGNIPSDYMVPAQSINATRLLMEKLVKLFQKFKMYQALKTVHILPSTVVHTSRPSYSEG